MDKETGLLKLDRFLYSAVHYPGDYGFIPQTLWEDGDPLDIVILTSSPGYPLTLASAKVIGVLQMVDEGEKDNKIIAVYDGDPRYKDFEDVHDIPKHTLQELKHFFNTYKELQGKKAKVLKVSNKKAALKDIAKGMNNYLHHKIT